MNDKDKNRLIDMLKAAKRAQFVIDFVRGKVHQISGTIETEVQHHGEGNVTLFINIGQLRFQVEDDVFDKFVNGRVYTIYYEPRNKTLVSWEKHYDSEINGITVQEAYQRLQDSHLFNHLSMDEDLEKLSGYTHDERAVDEGYAFYINFYGKNWIVDVEGSNRYEIHILLTPRLDAAIDSLLGLLHMVNHSTEPNVLRTLFMCHNQWLVAQVIDKNTIQIINAEIENRHIYWTPFAVNTAFTDNNHTILNEYTLHFNDNGTWTITIDGLDNYPDPIHMDTLEEATQKVLEIHKQFIEQQKH